MMQIIKSIQDPFGGVNVSPDDLVPSPTKFKDQLRSSLIAWKRQGVKVVWIKLDLSKSNLIPIAVGLGFNFHHSSQDYLMLTHQIVKSSYIPPYATHYIGVGGVVLNADKQILVVSEKYRSQYKEPSYKLPGGAVHQGEHLEAAIIREIFEETGIETSFHSLVCFRHWHGYRYNKSDIYFVCRLEPLTLNISMQIEEIDECLWMSIDKYMNSNHVSNFNKKIVGAALDSQGVVPTKMEDYTNEERYEFFYPG